MSRIKGKNTKPEIHVRKFLYSKGLRYRLHSVLPGIPDIVFASRRIAVFVHGCFWHMHGCKNSVMPKTNRKFWQNKLTGNLKRDKSNTGKLKKLGWKVLTIWECELDNKNKLNSLYNSITGTD